VESYKRFPKNGCTGFSPWLLGRLLNNVMTSSIFGKYADRRLIVATSMKEVFRPDEKGKQPGRRECRWGARPCHRPRAGRLPATVPHYFLHSGDDAERAALQPAGHRKPPRSRLLPHSARGVRMPARAFAAFVDKLGLPRRLIDVGV